MSKQLNTLPWFARPSRAGQKCAFLLFGVTDPQTIRPYLLQRFKDMGRVKESKDFKIIKLLLTLMYFCLNILSRLSGQRSLFMWWSLLLSTLRPTQNPTFTKDVNCFQYMASTKGFLCARQLTIFRIQRFWCP